MKENLEPNNEINIEIKDNTKKSNTEELIMSNSEKLNDQEKEIKVEKNTNNSENKIISNVETNNDKTAPNKNIPKPKKELPIEKKPFQEFINTHLIPTLIEEINQRGLKIININLENTNRPIAGDKCWVISCEIEDTCNFWLSFEKEDISSLKSISLSKPNHKPSIIESFLIDEKRITLKLIISRVLQRLNEQKLIGVN